MAADRQFIILPAQVLKDPRLDAPAKLVLMALAARANKHGLCWPGVERLAAETSYSERSVIRALRVLEEAGRIERIKRGRGLTAMTRVIYDTPISELMAAYAAGGADPDDEDSLEQDLLRGDALLDAYEEASEPADEGLRRSDEVPLVENKKCHGGTSGGGEGSRSATVAPPEVPHSHPELRAVELNRSSSSVRDEKGEGVSTRTDNAHADAEDAGSEASGQIAESRGRGRGRGESAPPAEIAAALRAPDSAPPAPAADDPDLHIGLASRFTDADHRAAYLGYRRGHRFPTAYDAELRTLNEPMTGGQPVPWDVIGRQLLQLQGNGEVFNTRLLAGYCRSAMAPRERPTPRTSARGPDKSTATRSEFLQLVGQPEERAS